MKSFSDANRFLSNCVLCEERRRAKAQVGDSIIVANRDMRFQRKLRRRQKVCSRSSTETSKSTAGQRNHTHTQRSTTMLLPRIRALPTGSSPAITTIETALSALRLSTPAVNTSSIAVRHASHKAQGAANSAKDGAGKRLGAKKSGGMWQSFPERAIHMHLHTRPFSPTPILQRAHAHPYEPPPARGKRTRN